MSALIDVLLVESEPKKLKRYKSMSLWKELGFRVTAAASSGEGLRKLREGSFGLIVTVNRLPEADAEEMLEKRGNAAAIVIVPRNSGESVGRYFGLGACDVIAEPPSRSRLRRALMRAHRLVKKGEVSEEYLRAAEKAFGALKWADESFKLRLRDFIERSEGEAVTTSSAAESLSFNKDYFGKLFKQETGVSFNCFYNNFRIEYAKELLDSSVLRVCEISELLGYSTVDYFTSVFRRQTGLTPSGWRGR
ncbi:response regulator [Ruminococcus sp.]|uniref:response regulator n=1 Tax=Ruminococcus sp. TaxID=41978 RepID=UPI0025F0C688|nr:response regulator [Ruminococcus sp.]MBQ8967383.1 helix-turn-helix domain-containing protein [Ruminococcus sp.]